LPRRQLGDQNRIDEIAGQARRKKNERGGDKPLLKQGCSAERKKKEKREISVFTENTRGGGVFISEGRVLKLELLTAILKVR